MVQSQKITTLSHCIILVLRFWISKQSIVSSHFLRYFVILLFIVYLTEKQGTKTEKLSHRVPHSSREYSSETIFREKMKNISSIKNGWLRWGVYLYWFSCFLIFLFGYKSRKSILDKNPCNMTYSNSNMHQLNVTNSR